MVGRAANTFASAIQHVGIDHRCAHVLVSQELLHGANVVAVLEVVSGEGMPEGMGGGELRRRGSGDGVEDSPSDDFFVDAVTAAW